MDYLNSKEHKTCISTFDTILLFAMNYPKWNWPTAYHT